MIESTQRFKKVEVLSMDFILTLFRDLFLLLSSLKALGYL